MGGTKLLGAGTTVLALINGMIGGSILVLPVNSLEVGWAPTLLIILLTGFFSFYTCFICIIHLGDQADLDSTLLRHFNGSKVFKVIYDFCVWAGLINLLMLYFQLIMRQWDGLISPPLVPNGLANAGFLLLWSVFLKYFQIGAHLMGYGIASIGFYLFFLIWAIASRPEGPRTAPAFGTGLAGFASMMGNAFSIQGFFVPVLRSYPRPQNYVKLLIMAYVIGASAYVYIAYMGCYGIANRGKGGETIQQFFQGGWQVRLLQGIYLLHLYSVFPQYLIVCKKRFFALCYLKETGRKRISWIELLYFIFAIGVCLLIGLLQVNINVIIDINGAVLGFCFVYLLPVLLHVRCTYFPKGKRILTIKEIEGQAKTQNQQSEGEDIGSDPGSLPSEKQSRVPTVPIQTIQREDKSQSFEIELRKIDVPQTPGTGGRGVEVQLRNGRLEEKMLDGSQAKGQDFSYFYCGWSKPSLGRQILMLGLLGLMFGMGVFIMVFGLIQVVHTIQKG